VVAHAAAGVVAGRRARLTGSEEGGGDGALGGGGGGWCPQLSWVAEPHPAQVTGVFQRLLTSLQAFDATVVHMATGAGRPRGQPEVVRVFVRQLRRRLDALASAWNETAYLVLGVHSAAGAAVPADVAGGDAAVRCERLLLPTGDDDGNDGVGEWGADGGGGGSSVAAVGPTSGDDEDMASGDAFAAPTPLAETRNRHGGSFASGGGWHAVRPSSSALSVWGSDDAASGGSGAGGGWAAAGNARAWGSALSTVPPTPSASPVTSSRPPAGTGAGGGGGGAGRGGVDWSQLASIIRSPYGLGASVRVDVHGAPTAPPDGSDVSGAGLAPGRELNAGKRHCYAGVGETGGAAGGAGAPPPAAALHPTKRPERAWREALARGLPTPPSAWTPTNAFAHQLAGLAAFSGLLEGVPAVVHSWVGGWIAAERRSEAAAAYGHGGAAVALGCVAAIAGDDEGDGDDDCAWVGGVAPPMPPLMQSAQPPASHAVAAPWTLPWAARPAGGAAGASHSSAAFASPRSPFAALSGGNGGGATTAAAAAAAVSGGAFASFGLWRGSAGGSAGSSPWKLAHAAPLVPAVSSPFAALTSLGGPAAPAGGGSSSGGGVMDEDL
jgi:hypothetical protein